MVDPDNVTVDESERFSELLHLKKQFLCCTPLKEIKWKDTLLYKLYESSESLVYQKLLLDNTVHHPIVKKFALKSSYQQMFIKCIINQLEAEGKEVLDELYSEYCRLLNETSDGSDSHYRHYMVACHGVDCITLKESSHIISQGTTGLCSWQASLALADWCINNHEYFEKKRVLELGSGVGLTGLVVSLCCRPSSYWFSDCHPSVLHLLQSNIALNTTCNEETLSHNGTQIEVLNLPWEDIPSSGISQLVSPHVVLAADVVFDSRLFRPLCEAFSHLLLNKSCCVLLACTLRNQHTLDSFLNMLTSEKLEISEEQLLPPKYIPYSDAVPVRLYRISGRDNMGEQPIFSCKAHVFHIDPKTKRSWISASSAAVSVSFFYDSTRSLYRIISVEGTKAVINSTITPNMTFTKTSQKFGQWSDVRANTVYGLGFSSEAELNKFIEKFQEVKEATRLASSKATANGTGSGVTPVTSANASPITARACVPPPRSTEMPLPPSDTTPLIDPPNSTNTTAPPVHNNATNPPAATPAPVTNNNAVPNAGSAGDTNTLKASMTAHQRSQSLSGLQPGESPKHQAKAAGDKPAAPAAAVSAIPAGSAEAQLKYENDRLKLALAQSSANAKKWEVELATLKNNNVRLTSALQESTANVEEWKRQLHSYKEENQRMKTKYIELEASK
ncbi:hypothetical protein L9F63_000528, partial [Diploptera punctata]